MARPLIVVNNATGSNTGTSGAGPVVPLAGVAALVVFNSTTVDLSADNPDLSGLLADGSEILLVDNVTEAVLSGHYVFASKIIAVDNILKTVQVTEGYPSSTVGSFDWAIGGKRSTLDHTVTRDIITGVSDADIEIQGTGVDYQLTAPINFGIPNGQTGVVRRFGTGTNRPILEQTSDGVSVAFIPHSCTFPGTLIFEHLKLVNSSVSPGIGIDANAVYGNICFVDCELGDQIKPLSEGYRQNYFNNQSPDTIVTFFNTTVHYCTAIGINTADLRELEIINSVVSNNAQEGISHGYDDTARLRVTNSRIQDNLSNGITSNFGETELVGVTITGNYQGFGANSGGTISVLANNIFAFNTQYGIYTVSPDNPVGYKVASNNVFFENTSGISNTYTLAPTDSVHDPFRTATNMDSPFQCGGDPVSVPQIGQNKKLILKIQVGSFQVNIKKDGVPSASAADYFLVGGETLDIIGPGIVTVVNITGDPLIYWTMETI